jgi:phosphoglycerate dehydrogenase-like enzyme
MSVDVVCLRPEGDFARVGVTPPSGLTVEYRAPQDADVPALLRAARALIIPAVGAKLAPELFENTALKLVQVTGAGLDRLNVVALRRLGIAVANVPGGSNSAVAEYAVTCASLLLRRFAWADAEIRRGNYASFRARMLADNLGGLEGQIVGIVGLGIIGLAVARAFHTAGARLCYFDPATPNTAAASEIGAKNLALDELLTMSDVVTLHVPLIPATRNMIGAAQLARMKPGAVLIQASRGGVVDEAALAARLQNGELGGAAVDVYSTEPPAADNPLLALTGEAAERLLLTPHIAGVTRQSSAFLFRSAWENVARVLLRGEPALNRMPAL